MKKTDFAKLFLAVALSTGLETRLEAQLSLEDAWNATLESVSYDAGADETTYTYEMCSLSREVWEGAGLRERDLKALSHWTLEFAVECQDTAERGDYQSIGRDATSELSGFIFDNGIEKFTCETFTIVINGFSQPEPGQYAVKAGTGVFLKPIDVPGCPGTPPSPPTISINDVSGRECDGPLTFQICLSKVWTEDVTVQYTTADGTAAAGSDYTAASGTVTIAAGQTCVDVVVGLTDDTESEGNETFVVNLSNPTEGTIADGQGEGTIENCDTPPTISINDVSGRECDGPLTFQICLSKVWTEDVTVQYTTADGTAAAGSDYAAASGTVTIAAGQTCVDVVVGLTDDTEPEGNETFVVNLSNPTGGTIADGQGEGTIENCDTPPTISINDVSGRECDGPLTFQICLSKVWTEDVTVQYTTADGTAAAGSDYTAASGTVTIAAGQTCVDVLVGLTDDTVAEGNETFVVNLSNPTEGTIGDGQGQGTIENCEPDLTITGDIVGECDSPATLNVCLSAVSDQAITFNYATSDGTAVAGVDYVAQSGTVTIPAGQLCATISIAINIETDNESDETFTVTISNAVGAGIAVAQATVTIEDCTVPPDEDPNLVIADPELVRECDATEVLFTVTLSEASANTVTVNYATQDVTATAGQDYVAAAGTLTFLPGETVKQVAITLTPDTDAESPEQFRVVLSDPTNAVLGDAIGESVIQDCDDDPTAVELVSFTVNQDGSGGLVLRWETASEFDSAGFHLFRANAEPGRTFEFERVTKRLIVSRGSTGEGAAYRHIDQPGYGSYVYQLEETELDGNRERRGTVAVDVRPRFKSIQVDNDRLILDFAVLDGWDYEVEYLDDLKSGEAGWVPLTGGRVGRGRVVDTVTPGKSMRVYRLTATSK